MNFNMINYELTIEAVIENDDKITEEKIKGKQNLQ